MKVLIADRLPETAILELEQSGFDVYSDPSLSGATLLNALGEHSPEILVVRSTVVDENMLDAAPHLGLIVRGGAGVNTIAVAAAAQRGVYVANCPGKNAAAVAELTFGLILSADRQIPNNVRDLRQGVWAKKRYSAARGLAGRTLALIGLGNIGREMIPRALGFGMVVRAWSRSLTAQTAAELGVQFAASPPEAIAGAEVVSIHLALNEHTRGFVNQAFVEALEPGAILVNTSRGGLVDEKALAWAIQNRQIRAGLDVYANEPKATDASFSNPLQHEEMLFGTHHIGASTIQAQEAVAAEAVRVIQSYRDDGDVPNCVNLCAQSPATHVLIVRHRNEVGVLAGIFDMLQASNINVQETRNVIFEGAAAAIARIRLEGAPPADVIDNITSPEQVLAVNLVELHE